MTSQRNLPALAAVLAFLIATPTLLNLAGVLINDGNSFTIIAGGALQRFHHHRDGDGQRLHDDQRRCQTDRCPQ